MLTQSHPSERGQAIVLLALAFVVLLGFTALAVDGSMVLSDRRYSQSASDAAALAGAAAAAEKIEAEGIIYETWACQSSDMKAVSNLAKTAAIKSAKNYEVTLDTDISDQLGVSTECHVESVGGILDKYLDVNVLITKETDTAFSQLIYSGGLRNTAQAVARIRPRSPLAYGYAIVALNPDDCQGMNTGAQFHGTADTIVDDGGVFSNGCLRGVGTQKITVNSAPIHYRVEYINNGNSAFLPKPGKVDHQLYPEDFEIVEPNCDHKDAHKITGKQLRGTLASGLWCVDGDATINAGDILVGNGVTIVMLNGRFHVNGHATVNITAPPADSNVSPAIPGILIYAPPSTNYRDVNKNGILLNGTSSSTFTGTILAPALDVYVNGTGSTDAYRTQVIGWNVQVGGTAETYVQYYDNFSFHKPPTLELNR